VGGGHQHLEEAEVFWISTVRPDGRPHVTPLLAVWAAEAMYFCTGSEERKAKNLKRNPNCTLTTGSNTLAESLDVVVEGQAAAVSDEAELQQVANIYESKYGKHLTAPEGTWFGLGDTIRRGEVLVYRVTPTTLLGFV
jgi:nitroimidazol reductase NimA-like FMN-containing flavoprotein (pyridoxamine 5'-phosphate oxidase superfamily)